MIGKGYRRTRGGRGTGGQEDRRKGEVGGWGQGGGVGG